MLKVKTQLEIAARNAEVDKYVWNYIACGHITRHTLQAQCLSFRNIHQIVHNINWLYIYKGWTPTGYKMNIISPQLR